MERHTTVDAAEGAPPLGYALRPYSGSPGVAAGAGAGLLRFASALFPITLPSERSFDTFLLARLQIERMLLDFLDDVLLLNLPFEAAKGVLKRLTFLNPHFRQYSHPLAV
jgi:hypothetical protein